MTSYATCAKVGCSNRIPYDPKEDDMRPRYCECHISEMEDRDPDMAYAKVARRK